MDPYRSPLAVVILFLTVPGICGEGSAPAILRGAGGAEAIFEAAGTGYRWAAYADPAEGRRWPIGGPGLGVLTADGRRAAIGDSASRLSATDREVVLEASLPDLALDVRRTFSFCDDGRTLRIRASLRSAGELVTVRRIGLLELRVEGQAFRLMGPETVSSPVFGDRIFAGLEHPSALCRAEGDSFSIAQPLYLKVGRERVDLPAAVLGSASDADMAAAGDEGLRRAFLRYLDTVRVKPKDLHVHYNDWWTAPVPSSEGFVLGNIAELKRGLRDPTGFFFDSYALDAGWSDPRSVWEIDVRQFPKRFAPIRAALEAAGGRVGLWISPSSLYPFALENGWLESAGYEVGRTSRGGTFACLAKGGKYQKAFKAAALAHAREADLAHMKFDGFVGRCDAPDHGHPTGDESCLPIAEGLLEVFDELRARSPDIALEPTCFGYRPSPWWLLHVPFIIGPFGDDSPYGRCPSPEYIDSMTTAREIKNREGRGQFLMPNSALQCFDIIVQCPGPFQDHAVMAIGRGRWFISCYIDPKFMDAGEWRFFADLMRWARHNRASLREPAPIGGDPAKREAYGYAFQDGARRLHCLRNPWIEEAGVALLGPPPETNVEVRMLYPRRSIIARLPKGAGAPTLPLGPYETQFVEVVPTDLPAMEPALPPEPAVTWKPSGEPQVEKVVFAADPPAFGPSWTSPDGNAESRTSLVAEGRLSVRESLDAQLCVLAEGDPSVCESACRIVLDGRDAAVSISKSQGSFGAAGEGWKEHWIWFLADVPNGEHEARIELTGPGAGARAGVFLRGGAAVPRPTAPFDSGPAFPLYRPDRRPWSRVLVPPAARSADPVRTRTAARRIVRIDGTYLDALDWVEASAGWGKVRRNRSIMEKPMTLGGKTYLRGIGAHALSRIAYKIPEGHRTFAATIGKDQEVPGGSVTFAVQADGKEVFRSGVFRNDTPPQEISLPIAGAKTLALIVEDAGDGIGADHGDWADARLLRD
jgi:hypothetical protein